MNDPEEQDIRTIDSDGESIYAEATGEGTPVVFCHGLGGNHAIWWRQIDTFAARHRVITWDQRGFGNSTATADDVSIKAAARDLAAVLAAFDLRHACVIGQSMGAFTALRAAIDGCDRIGSVIVSTSLAATDPEHSRKLNNAVGTNTGRNQHPVVSSEFSADERDLGILYNQISSFGAKPTSAAMLGHMEREVFTDEELRSIPVPVAFVAAENDVFCPPALMDGARRRCRQGTTLDVIPGSSHSAYYETPHAWNGLVLKVVDRLAADAGASR
ncbi:alpha/beta fold hydrolase [Streptomyces sp. NPDC001978]|uniref:alpha/beta fold hydrolase n=1 Tax=Streptomyces sp. NPDC001978 TaxID=3364627 RepID=UPI0036C98F45